MSLPRMFTGQEYLLNHLTDTMFAYLIIFLKVGFQKSKYHILVVVFQK